MADINSVASWNWNDWATWDWWVVPWTEDRVIINEDHIVTADWVCECWSSRRVTWYADANAQCLVYGKLKASRTVDSEIRVKWQILLKYNADVQKWMLDLWTNDDPIPADINCTLHLNYEKSYVSWEIRAVYWHYSWSKATLFSMVSEHLRRRNTYLIWEYSAGDTIINVNDATWWTVGDKLVIAPKWTETSTNIQYNSDYSIKYIESVNGNEITLTEWLDFDHWYSLEKDYEAWAISNYTSNCKIIGWDTSTKSYQVMIYRGWFAMNNVVLEYANNERNYNNSTIKPSQMCYLTWYPFEVKSSVMWWDMTDIKDYSENIFYSYNTYDYFPHTLDDITISHKPNDSYYAKATIYNYYAGRNIKMTNVNTYCLNRYAFSWFSAYQQPVTLTNCKAFNATIWYMFHNNVNANSKECRAVWCYRWFNTYNWTATYEDMRFRWVRFLWYMQSGWRWEASVVRPDFEDKHIYESWDRYMEYTSVPDGNKYKFIDIQNNPDKQITFFTYWVTWREKTQIRNTENSYWIKSINNDIPIVLQWNIPTKNWVVFSASWYITNYAWADYTWTIKVRLTQLWQTISEKTYDTTTFTKEEWNLFDIAWTSISDSEAELVVEVYWDGSELVMADVSAPPNFAFSTWWMDFWANASPEKMLVASYVSASDVWASLQSVNNVTWSMWEKLNQLENYNDTIAQDKLDAIKTETDKIQPEIIDKKDEFKATWFATQNPPSQNLDDYKADVSNLDVKVSSRKPDVVDFTSDDRDKLNSLENYDDSNVQTKLDNANSELVLTKAWAKKAWSQRFI